ncbi:hypothetical protein ACFYKX_25680 [Cytobacillus sp. FJAT-54145]|uniref:Uncharacterized protein n=1 Tax=Cytobacillus spartinae TaxID=3299023 RepID=A0ABW6KMA9_9BACI
MLKIVIFEANEEELEEQGLDFENEMNWLKESNIHVKSIIEIPEETMCDKELSTKLENYLKGV